MRQWKDKGIKSNEDTGGGKGGYVQEKQSTEIQGEYVSTEAGGRGKGRCKGRVGKENMINRMEKKMDEKQTTRDRGGAITRKYIERGYVERGGLRPMNGDEKRTQK